MLQYGHMLRISLSFFLLFALPALARVTSSVSASHSIYRTLDRLEAYGCAFPTLRLFAPQSHEDLVSAIDWDQGSQPGCKAPEWLMKERAYYLKPAVPQEFRGGLLIMPDDFISLPNLEAGISPLFPLRQGRVAFPGAQLYVEAALAASSSGEKAGFAFALTPGFRFGLRDYKTALADVYLQEGYAKFGWGWAELLLGRVGVEVGGTRHGSLLLTSWARPIDMVRLSVRPHVLSGVSFLGPVTLETWIASQGEQTTFVRNSRFWAWQLAIRPLSTWELGFVHLTQFGGEGVSSLEAGEVFQNLFLIGNPSMDQKRFQVALLHSGLWMFSKFFKVYGQAMVSTPSASSIDWQDRVSGLVGFWLPKMGDMELRVEVIKTARGAYQNPVWQQGLTYRNSPLGQPLGNDAFGAYVDLGLPPFENIHADVSGVWEDREPRPGSGQARERRYGGGIGLAHRWVGSEISVAAMFQQVENQAFIPNNTLQELAFQAWFKYWL